LANSFTIVSAINATTFYLFKKGFTAKLAATVSYCAATDTATLNPTNSIRAGVTYKNQNTKTGLQQKRWLFTMS